MLTITLNGLAPWSRAVSIVVRTSASAFCGPHGSVAVCDFSLDHARAEFALRGVVGDVDLPGIIAKGQKLVSRAPDFGLQFPGEVASGWRGQKRFELFFQLSFLPRERRGGEIGDGSGEVERLA